MKKVFYLGVLALSLSVASGSVLAAEEVAEVAALRPEIPSRLTPHFQYADSHLTRARQRCATLSQ